MRLRPDLRALTATSATAALVLVACTSSSRDDAAAPRADTSAPAPSAAAPIPTPPPGPSNSTSGHSVAFHRERTADLANDGNPFTITVDADGPAPDSMQVRLRISRDGAVLYRADWPTILYGVYDAKPVSRDSLERRTRARLADLLSDRAFVNVATLTRGASSPDRTLAEAIGFDVAVDAARKARGLTPADSLPTDIAQSPPPSTDSTRIRALVAELKSAPAFRYFAGGEATYTIAWSAREKRFVVVFACC